MKAITLPLLLLLPLLAGCSESPTPDTPVLTPGQQVFLNHCVACHQGSGSPPGPNDVIRRSAHLSSQEAFEAFLRKPTTPMMPPFPEGKLPDAAVEALYAYLSGNEEPAAD